MAPGVSGKRKRGDRNYSYDARDDSSRPSPHRPGNMSLAQQPQSQQAPPPPNLSRDQYDQRGGRRRGSRGGRGGGNQRSPINSPNSMTMQPRQSEMPRTSTVASSAQTQQPSEAQPDVGTQPSPASNITHTQTQEQQPRDLPTYHYEHATDEQCKVWNESGRAAIVAAGRKACQDQDETLLSLLFQDVLRAGLDGKIDASDAGSVIKEIVDTGPTQEAKAHGSQGRDFKPEELFLDVLSICAEAWNEGTTLRPVVLATGISAQLMRLVLDSSLLESLGLIRSTFVRVGIRQQTNVLYRQSNYNLLREETEGYSKLVTELFTTSSGETLSSEIVEETFERVKGMIGAFDLDVGRVLDVTLDVFAAVLVKQYRFFLKYLRTSSWWPQDKSADVRVTHGLDTLPKWALPGAAGRPMSDSERAAMTSARDERDVAFWDRARGIGMNAFFEIGNRRPESVELQQAMDAALTANSAEGDEDQIWMDITGTLPPVGNKVAAQILGFKLRFYSSSARDAADVLPINIIFLAALLIKVGFISLRDLYPHLWPSEEAMGAVKESKVKENAEKERLSKPGGGMPNALLTAGALTDDTIDPRRARELAKKREMEAAKFASSDTDAGAMDTTADVATDEKEELPEPAEQKVQLLKSLLCIGAIPESLYMLGRFPWLPDVFTELPEHIHRILHHCLSKVYEPLRPLKDHNDLREPARLLDGEHSAIGRGTLRFVDAPPRKIMRWAQLDKDDTNEGIDYKFYWDDWADSVPVCQSVDDVFLLCSTLLNLSGVKIGQDSSLYLKLCRIGHHSLDTDRSQANKSRWLDLCKRILLPALSLTKSNASVANEVFELIKGFSVQTRYSLYAEWFQGQTSRVPEVKAALDKARSETRDVLKRISKSNLKSMARALAKIAYSSPGAVFQLAISQIEIYENLAETFTECARYLTYLAYDVFNWTLLSAVGGAGKSRVQADGMLTSHWLQSLTVLISKVYKRYSVMSPVPMLQYVLDQLTQGNSVDLIVLEEMVTAMAGIVSDTNFNDNQVVAMAGGDLLQAQTMLQLLDRRHESRTSAKRLMRCLAEPKLAGQLLVAIAQERENCVYNLLDKDAPAKLLGNLFDEVHRVFSQYLDFMRATSPVAEFGTLVPGVVSLITDFGVEPGIAFWISRASIAAAITEYDTTHSINGSDPKPSPIKELVENEVFKPDIQAPKPSKDADNKTLGQGQADQSGIAGPIGDTISKSEPETTEIEMKDVDQATVQLSSPPPSDPTPVQQPWHPILRDIMERLLSSSPGEKWKNLSPSFYVTFWQLALRDMHVPTQSYEDEQARLRKKISNISSDRSDIGIQATQRKEREKRAVNELMDRLMSEHKERITAFSRTRARLQKEKTSWFVDMWGRWEALNTALIEQCFLPRIRISSVDALYAFKMFKFLHSSGTTAFRTLGFLDRLFKEKRLENILFLCSAKEAEHFGRFLREVLKDLARWHADKAVFEKEAFGIKKDLKGFCTKMSLDGSSNVYMDFEDFRRILNKWHININKALKTCFTSGEYMHIRNAINVLKAIVQQFPAINWMGKVQGDCIEQLTKTEVNRADLNLAAASLLGNLRRREKEWVLPQAFSLSPNDHGLNGAAAARSSSAKPSTPQPESETPKPLNPKAAAFEPNGRPMNSSLPKPNKSGDPDAEDGEIEDAKMNDANASGSSVKPAEQNVVIPNHSGPAAATTGGSLHEAPKNPVIPSATLPTASQTPQTTNTSQQASTQDKPTSQVNRLTPSPAISQASIPPYSETGRSTSSPSANGRLQHSLPDRPEMSTSRIGQHRIPDRLGDRPPRDVGRDQRFQTGPMDDHRNRVPARENIAHQARNQDPSYGRLQLGSRDRPYSSLPNGGFRQDQDVPHGGQLRSDSSIRGESQATAARERQSLNHHVAVDSKPSAAAAKDSMMPPPQSSIPHHPDRAALLHGNRSLDQPSSSNQQLDRRPEPPTIDRSTRGASPVRSDDRRPFRNDGRRDLRHDDRLPAIDRRNFSDSAHSNPPRYDGGHPPAGPRTERPGNLDQSGPHDRFRDSMKAPPSARPPIDPHHGRLNQDSSYNGQRSDQYGRLSSSSEVPSGPRMTNGNAPPSRNARNVSAPQPQTNSRPAQNENNATPQSPTMGRQAPTGPSSDRGPVRSTATYAPQDSGNSSAQTTPVKEAQDVAGIHPDRLKALQGLNNPPASQNPNNIQVQGSMGRPPPPRQQPPPVSVPRGPANQQTPPSPVGPSPTNRGPPIGPGRSDKRFAGIQGVLQQANGPTGPERTGQGTSIRGRGGRPNNASMHSPTNSAPPTPSTQRPDPFPQRQDLFAGRTSGPSIPHYPNEEDDSAYNRNARKGPMRDGTVLLLETPALITENPIAALLHAIKAVATSAAIMALPLLRATTTIMTLVHLIHPRDVMTAAVEICDLPAMDPFRLLLMI
ncbi:MAG: hypothetical protein Q9222_005463 [Ikaeria aurantiellina]